MAPPVEEVKQSQITTLSAEQLLMQENPSMHWSDIMIKAEKTTLLDLED